MPQHHKQSALNWSRISF